jgi:diguanylate cyclase (GGDEF)-like protein
MEKLKNFWDKKLFRQVSYFLFIILTILFLGYLGQKIFNIGQLLETYELKTYDLRLKTYYDLNNDKPDKTKKVNSDIVIVSIDNASLDMLESDLGRWPWSRDVYTDTINYLEKDNVDLINFDMMFVGYQKGFENKDIELANTIKKHNNIYASMSFDNRNEDEIKNAPDLPKLLSAKLENKSKTINFKKFDFNYCNLILDRIINGTKNIGIINFLRDEDNVSRRSPTFFKYKEKFYPYMPLKLASDYISKHEKINADKFVINKKNQLLFGSRKIQLDDQGSMIINWYGPEYKFIYVPFWKIYKSIENEKMGLPPVPPLAKGDFKNKIVFLGVTATSLYDIKTTPLSAIYPGVEVQATVLNNILDNNPIKRASNNINFGICLFLGLLIAIAVIKIRQPILSTLISILILSSYVGFASYMLNEHNLWLDILPQIVFAILTFTFMFIIKYVLKSKDFDYTYKLATTDGLTNLYNHRYFQEHLTKCMKKADKNNTRFALILIDIDHFKKFNDTYGHQAGDEVLRQVGQTLRKAVKSHDLVARYGGEEMVIVIDRAHTEDALKAANRICKAIADRNFELAEGLSVNVTISLGVAVYPIDGRTSTELIEFSDQGLYRAKHNGRNQVGSLPEIKIITAE